jgi:DNA-binding transcriptional LysR family regulator
MPRDRGSSEVADATHGLQVLVAIADGGAFTAASARLGLTPSAVSKAVTRVEARLGVRLLQRTTRRVAFTEAGEAYIARGRQLIADFEGLERETSSRHDTMRGTRCVRGASRRGAGDEEDLRALFADAIPTAAGARARRSSRA